MIFTDSHAHLTSPQILPDVDAVLKRAHANGVDKIINICTDAQSFQEGLALAKRKKGIYNTAATTPHDVEKDGEKDFSLFEEAAKKGQLVAVGETGLDYFYEHSNRELQKTFLIRYFRLALETHLPVVIHCRDAFDDLYAIADANFGKNTVIMHCFTGNIAEAKKALDRGWMISFSGIVTFKKSDSLREVAKFVPLKNMLIETDSPYLAPQSKRGKCNEPSYLLETAEIIAAVRSESVELIAQETTQNAQRIFSI